MVPSLILLFLPVLALAIGFWLGAASACLRRKEPIPAVGDAPPVADAAGLWRQVMAASGQGVLVSAAAGNRIVAVNAAFERITGYARHEVLGRDCRFLYGADTGQPGLEALWAAIGAGQECRVLLRSYRKNGSLFWNDFRYAPARDGQGRITHHIGIVQDVSDHQFDRHRLARLCNHDELTRLANRKLYLDRLDSAIHDAREQRTMVAVLSLNLDRFRAVNESLGHRLGDRLLQALAGRLRGAVRPADTVGRLWADEFAVTLTGLSRADLALDKARELMGIVNMPFVIDGHELFMTCGIGISRYPQDGADAQVLLHRAVTAMNCAKDCGRNGLETFLPVMTANSDRRLSMEGALRQALDRGQLQIHYQPQFQLSGGRIVGVEALLRWRHPELGPVPPQEFIPLAEETGLIIPIGEWVMSQA